MTTSDDRCCTLALEYDYPAAGSARSMGSVWLYPGGDGTPDLDTDAPLDSLPGWLQIAGPGAYEKASKLHAGMKELLEAVDVQVIDVGIVG